jgi:hypothetical protein
MSTLSRRAHTEAGGSAARTAAESGGGCARVAVAGTWCGCDCDRAGNGGAARSVGDRGDRLPGHGDAAEVVFRENEEHRRCATCAPVRGETSGLLKTPMDFHGLSAAVPKPRTAPLARAPLTGTAWKAEGEGFEPSIRLTTDNGFRDRYELADLQVFSRPAPVCAPVARRSCTAQSTPSLPCAPNRNWWQPAATDAP